MTWLHDPLDATPFGVFAVGELADILVRDGDPETGLDLLDDPATNLRQIRNGGRIRKKQPA
ncbi:MAG TPA: Xaa-Pro dipeptidase [Paracoccaceae bacterium]|nr:Xaa-Pro dipeptidase [Paracoccaceae bacterium]HMO71190.1 Xaa-Pro dipeptidase [Paracoccaceae bacterium]